MEVVRLGREEDDRAKMPTAGTTAIWAERVVMGLRVKGTRLVEEFGTWGGDAGDRSCVSTDAGSSLIDMGNEFANSQSIGNSIHLRPSSRTRRYFSWVSRRSGA